LATLASLAVFLRPFVSWCLCGEFLNSGFWILVSGF
jgi:hypothetical protein